MVWYVWVIGLIVVAYIIRRFCNGPWYSKRKDLTSKTIIITGSSAGIGKETAFDLLENGAYVIFACRDEKKTRDVIAEIKNPDSRARATFMRIDLTDVNSIINFNSEYRKQVNRDIDMLINNAGYTEDRFRLFEGVESSLMANHVGHKILTMLLLDKFNRNEARIINVASYAHYFSNYTVEELKRLQNNLSFEGEGPYSMYKAFTQYGNTKLANVFFTQYLAEKLSRDYPNIKITCLHPGTVNTEFLRTLDNLPVWSKPFLTLIFKPFFWFISKTPLAGIQTTLTCVYEDFEKLVNGAYYSDCKKSPISATASNESIRNEFIKYSWMLVDKVTEGKVKLQKL